MALNLIILLPLNWTPTIDKFWFWVALLMTLCMTAILANTHWKYVLNTHPHKYHVLTWTSSDKRTAFCKHYPKNITKFNPILLFCNNCNFSVYGSVSPLFLVRFPAVHSHTEICTCMYFFTAMILLRMIARTTTDCTGRCSTFNTYTSWWGKN